MDKLRIGVIFGGRSGEHEVSLMSARSVLSAINPDKYDVIQIGITHDGEWLTGDNVLVSLESGDTETLTPITLLPDPNQKGLCFIRRDKKAQEVSENIDIDIFFPILHGTFGEDGTIQGLFELAGVPYVGAGVLGSSLGMDKGVFKDIMRANDIPVVKAEVVLRSELSGDHEEITTRLEKVSPYPLFTKPANMGSSVGVTKCQNRSDLIEGLFEAARYDRRILVEKGIKAREIEISVLGNDDPIASIPGEICPAADFYTYEAKYHDDRSELIIPAVLPQRMVQNLRNDSISAFKAIDCAGMARVDFLVDIDTNEYYLNELNTIPGFTQISMYPKLWEASGLSYSELITRLIHLALERRYDRNRNENSYHH